MTTAFHGTAVWQIVDLLTGEAKQWHDLYVTESADLAQRYADAVASREVSADIRRVKGSAVVELETEDVIVWSRRPANHNTLDVCEAAIKTWSIKSVTIYTERYELDHSVVKVSGKYVKIYPYLQERLGDRLELVVTE